MLKTSMFAMEGTDPEFFVFLVHGLEKRMVVSWTTASIQGSAIRESISSSASAW